MRKLETEGQNFKFGICETHQKVEQIIVASLHSITSGSNSGYKWQPVSDLEWVRLFERYWFNKRVTMSHSDSYIFESNPGKPKMVRKGQGKKGRGAGGGVIMANVHGRKPESKRGNCKRDDRKHMKRE